jgi:hypothetical protein
MSTLTYTRYELLRTFRNRRFFLLSLAFPLVLYFLIAGPNRDVHSLSGTGISAPLYFMVGLVSFGTMSAMLSSGARTAATPRGYSRPDRPKPAVSGPRRSCWCPNTGGDCLSHARGYQAAPMPFNCGSGGRIRTDTSTRDSRACCRYTTPESRRGA